MFRLKSRGPATQSRGSATRGKKRRLWPILSIALLSCYLAVLAWYFIYGFEEKLGEIETSR